MKIKYIALCLLLALVGCQRDEEMEVTQLTISNEHIEPSYSSAIISCDITTNITIKSALVYVSESADFSNAIKQVLNRKDGNTYSAKIDGLSDETTYYVRYQISNRWVSLMAEEISEFQTIPATKPTVTTTQPKEITHNSAIVGGNIVDNGGLTITNCGVVYSTNQNPTTNDNKVTNGSGLDTYNCNLTDLQDGTTYYARAYAINEIGTAYGEEMSFTTKAKTTATVITTQTTNVSNVSATIGGNVTDDGGSNVTERGICYSTSVNPTTANTKILAGSGTGEFTCDITDLQEGTKYYVRAYAINEKGTAYGEEVNFTTKTIATPVVTTNTPSEITYTRVMIKGTVTDDGGATVTEKGVCYSTSPNPTIDSNKRANGSGTGTITCVLSDLQDGTTYYARAYAVNAMGVGYGNEVSFTTTAYEVPQISIVDPTEYSASTATIDCEVTFDGGLAVTERGVCYSTTSNPTYSNSKVRRGSGLGAYSCELSNLSENTTYYVRAYAKNAEGIGYSEEVSFTTMVPEVPQISIVNPKEYSVTTATIDCEVTFEGGLEVTERGVCYSTTSNPTYSNDIVKSGSGLGAYSCELSNLSENTTYYIRAYAKNAEGIGYSEEVSFTTRTRTYMDGYEYVDLGLSVKWATMNVGASSPEDYGDYFAWGETTTKSTYNWSTYTLCKGSSNTLTKYNTSSSYGTVDNKTTLELRDDAAHVNWGGNWRMPTDAELTELLEQCTWTWTSQNGVKGYKLTSKSNGNSIFLPAAGYCSDSSLYGAGSYGHYRSSSLYTGNPDLAWNVMFIYWGDVGRGSYNRYEGFTIRPVCP